MSRVLVARLDGDGDVLLAGPAVRAAAAGGAEVTVLCGPGGRQAADLLPDVASVLEWACPWIAADPPPVDGADVSRLLESLRARRFDVAVVLTSFHQSSLPLALLLRLAGVPRIVGISTDYPGSLLDVRLRPGEDFDDDRPEPLRALDVVRAAGFAPPPGDDGLLRVLLPPDTTALTGPPGHVVVHPGATAPSRTWSPDHWADAVALLADDGHRVVVTGGPDERELTAAVAGSRALDLGGRTSFRELSGVLATARAVVVGNTGPAHLAAAVGTPVVSLFSPVVPARRWAPYGVPHVLLGDQYAPCRGSRARTCPVPGHPCLDLVDPGEVVTAVEKLVEVGR
ncbi:glycosyltransferase family 9 protein [Umezawaea beigongshangensis]|uniref:glycosyltransferase family 9 protein n=1 Tax=Umezawaea beigongshangensis TaxID=2780383 RepID=UPI0018F2540D|nr:glycosyltransferase family 9 protein [Umezawaea beigongshangensis]